MKSRKKVLLRKVKLRVFCEVEGHKVAPLRVLLDSKGRLTVQACEACLDDTYNEGYQEGRRVL